MYTNPAGYLCVLHGSTWELLYTPYRKQLNPLTAIDANWRHENCWWCYFLGNFPSKIQCRFCGSRKGGMQGGGWVPPKGENGTSQALGSLWSTHARSWEGHMPCFEHMWMQETVLSPCSASKLHVHGCFLCQSALTLSEQKLKSRKWVWLDLQITTNRLAMPGPVAVCILEPEKPTGPEIRYV